MNTLKTNRSALDMNTELCVYCGRATGIPKALPIDLRKYYIYGCGQLCENCYKKIALKARDAK